eukprot:UN09471
MCHGANPGLVTHFMRRALQDLWKRLYKNKKYPKSDVLAAKQLGVIHVDVVEDDQQDIEKCKNGKYRKILDYKNNFYCSWSPYAFYYENVGQVEVVTPKGPLVIEREGEVSGVSWSPT